MCLDRVATAGEAVRAVLSDPAATLRRVNVEWVARKLGTFLEELRTFESSGAHYASSQYESLVSQEPTIKSILQKFDLESTDFSLGNPAKRTAARKNVIRALGIIRDQEEVAQNLGPPSIEVATDRLHPVVWDAASALWEDGHFGQAVQRAATFLSAHVKDLVKRQDVQDVPLMQQVLSNADPESGKPRLRWPGDPSNLTVKSMNDGLRLFAPGAFMTIRNPATHVTDDVPEHEALEQLATLSLLARWIDGCELIEAPS